MTLSDVARLALAAPSVDLYASYAAFIVELRAAGDTVWPSRVPLVDEAPAAFVARLAAKQVSAEPPMVEESVRWATVGDYVVGVIALRHRLTEQLAAFGGHVGYEVRPSWRRRGVATGMLRLVLATERARAMGRILVTCAPDNAGSRRAIEANGGALAEVAWVEAVKRETCRYWIDVAR